MPGLPAFDFLIEGDLPKSEIRSSTSNGGSRSSISMSCFPQLSGQQSSFRTLSFVDQPFRTRELFSGGASVRISVKQGNDRRLSRSARKDCLRDNFGCAPCWQSGFHQGAQIASPDSGTHQ